MLWRPKRQFEPSFERVEARLVLSAGGSASNVVQFGESASPVATIEASGTSLPHRFLAFRVTNPAVFSNLLIPPFDQVLVQSRQPVPGQVYNILFVSVRNGTAQTFTASNNFRVRLTNGEPNGPSTGGASFPILTGSQTWQPRQVFVFYVLTKEYYPVAQLSGGFQLDLGGASSTLVPGPSGIFLRIKYNPATFAHALNQIVAFGQGNQGGIGTKFGLPNTAVNEFVSAKTRRIDFGGHF
jgi:hypothetical protein